MAAYAGGADGKTLTRGERIAQARAGNRPKPSAASGRKPRRKKTQ